MILAHEAVQAVTPHLCFWAWWSKDSAGDVDVAQWCVERGIPVIFVGEPRGGITGSSALWDNPSWTIRPTSGMSIAGGAPFRDLPSWSGFRDCTWLLLGQSDDNDVSRQLAGMSIDTS